MAFLLQTRVADARPTRRRGAVLVEAVVVTLIIALLVALLVPMFVHAQDRSARARCMNNLRKIGRALRDYADDHGGKLPTTRPAAVPPLEVMRPDLSNAGFDQPDPFAPGAVPPNNVPAAVFLLVRTGYLDTDTFVCPGTSQVPDRWGPAPANTRSNFTDVSLNLSYAIQNPYADATAAASGFKWERGLPAEYPLAADRGPAISDGALLPLANSRNHRSTGQNVLYADGSVAFRLSPLAGIGQDHIYLTRDRRVVDSPRDALDSILLPPQP